MSDTDRQPECRSYGAGHNVHYIQANRARRHPENRRSGTITSVAGQTVELNLDDGEVVQLWTHDAVRVERLVEEVAQGRTTTAIGVSSTSTEPTP